MRWWIELSLFKLLILLFLCRAVGDREEDDLLALGRKVALSMGSLAEAASASY